MKKSVLSMIMKRAWTICRATGEIFAACLTRAWALWRLTKKLASEVVRFTYYKKDGSLRHAVGTNNNVDQFIKGTGSSVAPIGTIKYYDLEAQGFRSFCIQNFVNMI